MTRRLLPILLGVLLSVGTSASRADFVTTIAPSIGFDPATQLYLYQYQVTNASVAGSGDSLASFALTLPGGANLSALLNPTGWDAFYETGDLTIDWVAEDLVNLLTPGQTLTFGFSSTLAPDDILYSLAGVPPDLSTFDIQSGTTLGPSAESVPEPSSLGLLGLGATIAAGAGARSARARRRA